MGPQSNIPRVFMRRERGMSGTYPCEEQQAICKLRREPTLLIPNCPESDAVVSPSTTICQDSGLSLPSFLCLRQSKGQSIGRNFHTKVYLVSLLLSFHFWFSEVSLLINLIKLIYTLLKYLMTW